jgi:hypothetical protein
MSFEIELKVTCYVLQKKVATGLKKKQIEKKGALRSFAETLCIAYDSFSITWTGAAANCLEKG